MGGNEVKISFKKSVNKKTSDHNYWEKNEDRQQEFMLRDIQLPSSAVAAAEIHANLHF